MRREGQAPPLRNSPISFSPRRGSLEQRAATRGRPYREGEISWGGRVRTPAPTEGNEPGTLIRTTQAQKRNRTSHNFSFAQAPSGAGRNRTQALLILRAGRILPTSRGNPRIRGPGPTPSVRGRCRVATEGVGWRSYGHEVPVGRVPRRSFGFFPIAGKETRRPQAAKLPCEKSHPAAR